MAGYAFRVPFHLVEPRDPSWLAADPATRREFGRVVVRLVLQAKDRELAAGKDRHGADLVPIAASTRAHRRSAMGPADPDAPPLTPAYALSRTRSLLAGRAHGDHALFFWRKDPVTGKPWGRILGYHRQGKGRLPVRDVIGLSPQSLAWVQSQAEAWWQARRRAQAFYASGSAFKIPTPSANGMPRPVPRPRRGIKVVEVRHYTHLVAHTSRPAEANAPPKPGDFVTGFRQRRRAR